MDTLNIKNLFFSSLLAALTAFAVFAPLPVFAEVVPLAPLPTNFGQNTDTLGGYLNTIFYTVIAGAAILAVLRIVWGGFQYMTSEAVTQTKDARTIITMAIVGLILLLASWLILYVINPSLTRLDALDFDFTPLDAVSGQTDFALGSGETLTQAQIDATLQNDTFEESKNPVSGDTLQSSTDVSSATNKDLTNLANACAAKGSEYSSSVSVTRTCKASSNGTRYGKQVVAGEVYETSSATQQNLFGADASVAARCNPGDALISKQKYFICEKPI